MRYILRKASALLLGLICLPILASCSTISDVHQKDSNLEMRIDHLSGKVLKTGKPFAWEEGIRSLAVRMVSRLPAEGVLTIRVGEFSEGRSGGRVPLSGRIESDIRATLASVEDIRVLDEVQDQVDTDFLLTGLFRRDGDVLRINATLKDMKTGAITGAGRVLIRADEIQAEDLLPAEFPPLQKGGERGLSYDTIVEQILTVENSADPFHVKIWTDKSQFKIGDPVTFYLKTDRDCYVTLLDQGTSGVLRVLFPNPYQRDNFIHAGKTYAVPEPSSAYEVRVDGPPGIERVKAIATLEKSDQPYLDISEGFYELSSQEDGRLRDLNSTVMKLSDPQWAQEELEISISVPSGTENGRPRKMKPKRPDKPVDIIGTPGAVERPEK